MLKIVEKLQHVEQELKQELKYAKKEDLGNL